MLGFSRRLMTGISRRLPRGSQSAPSALYGLHTVVWMMLLLTLPLLQSKVRQVHQINCPYNYYHTNGPLMFNAPAIEAATRIKTAQGFKPSGFVDRWMNWVPTTALTDFTPDTTYYLEKLKGRELDYIFMSWDSKLGMMVIQLYPRGVLNNRNELLPDSAANWNYDNGAQIWVRCRPSWRPDSNRVTIAFLNQKIVQYLKPWIPATVTAAAITADTDRHLEYHNSHLGQFLIDKQKFWFSLVGLIVLVVSHIVAMFKVRRYFDRLRQQFRGDEYQLPRMPMWRLLLAWNIDRAISWYKADLETRRRLKKQAIRMQGREGLVEEVLFDLAARTLPEFEMQLHGHPIPPRLKRYWKRANNDSLKIEMRLEALDRLRRWWRDEQHEQSMPAATDADYRQHLLARVKALDLNGLSSATRLKIIEAKEQFERVQGDSRRHLGDYWLERMIQLATVPEPSTAAVSTNGHVAPATSTTSELPRNLEDVVELFDIRDLLPPDIDHEHARAIIVWGLMHPGQRGRSMFKARYITIQWLQKDVQSKLGRDYDADAYQTAFDFLKRTRVIMTEHKAKRHQPIAALNPHASDGVEQGPEIIRRVLAMRDVLTELSVT